MKISELFGRSPFESLVEHARKVHQCVAMVRPVAEAVLAQDMGTLSELQHDMSRTEYEADLLKDRVRERLPKRYFLPVSRGDVARYLAEMDKIADDAEDFAIIATLRHIDVPRELHGPFLVLVDKVLEVGGSLLDVAEQLGELQKESFVGPESEDLLEKIQQVCHMEWESDKLNRRFARRLFRIDGIDPITIMMIEKLTSSLSRLADHAENVGKNLRLMITRK